MKLKSIFIGLLIITISTFKLSAQLVKYSFGVTGGAVGTQMNTNPAPTNPSLFYISGYGGAFATVNVGRVVGVRTGVNYAMTGGQYDFSTYNVTLSQSYLQIPVGLLLHAGRALSLEVGLEQNILLQSKYLESGAETVEITPDEGALKYHFGAMAGVNLNFGKVVFLSMKYHYGLSKAYVLNGVGYPSNMISVGLGFNIYNSRKSAFR